MWKRLLENLDAGLVAALTLDRCLVSRDGEKMQVRFHAGRLLSDKEFRQIQERMRAGFPGARVSARISYPALREDVLKDVGRYARFVGALVSDEKPGAMPYLFWDDAKWRLSEDGQILHIAVNGRMGEQFLAAQGIDRRVEELMEQLFHIVCRVVIDVIGDEEQKLRLIEDKRREEEERLRRICLETEKIAEAARSQKPAGGALMGKEFSDARTPIGDLTEDAGKVALEGEVTASEWRDLKEGSGKLLVFSMTDRTGSVSCKTFLGGKRGERGEALQRQEEAIAAVVKPGSWIKLRGEYRYDEFQRGMTVMVRDMAPAEAPVREDTAERKRVELHLHTHMSAMDATSSPTELIEQAARWGHTAIAITDHGVAQAFPEAFSAAEKVGIRLVPGCEAYLIGDTAELVKGADDRQLSGTAYVVLDVETTGLKASRDAIIELGAVRIENGKEVAEFSQLVNPNRPLPENIIGITGITDGMLRDMPDQRQVFPQFLRFIEGAVLVAHNADFDMGFLRRAAEAQGTAIEVPVIDTLTAARAMLPSLKSHRLGALCKHFGISLKKAHRAVHDARATSQVFLRMLEEMKASRLSELNELFDAGAGGSSHHVILLATSQQGITNLYRLISEAHLHHFRRTPRVPRGLIRKYRQGLLVGSACEAGELYQAALEGKTDGELTAVARFYDYLEIQPLENNEFLIREGRVPDAEALREINRRIVALGERMGLPVVATGDVHFKDPHEAVYRSILMTAKGFEDADNQPPLYFRTTDDMLREFAYLGEEAAERVVVDAPNEIAARVGDVRVFPQDKETYQPYWEFAEAEIREASETRARDIYGDPLPPAVRGRLDKELGSIIEHGFSTLYDSAVKLVSKSLADGYIVGSRGSIGSSLVAFLTGITEVNALPPHYVCPACKRSEFSVPDGFSCGMDLPEKACPGCGGPMNRDGFDIPFEVFLGFKGDKVPDIDLNFSGEYQSTAHQYVKELFGADKVFRAGTISTVADKTAYGYVLKYLERNNLSVSNAEKERLARGCTGVKRTTGQHPAGMVVLPEGYEIYQFTPIQRPADDPESEVVTTHFDFSSMHDVLVKLDVLGHDDPTMLKQLQDLTGIAPRQIPLRDPKVFHSILSLFRGTEALGVTPEQIDASTGTLGIPEFGTRFVRQMLMDTKPSTMEELIRISGLSHGTAVWLGNAQDLVRNGVATLRECICTRDDIMNQLIRLGVPDLMAFTIMESVRKGKGLKPEMEQAMREAQTPDWFIESCKKIAYMFPKAHAVAYVTMALRIAYFKIYHPEAYYACYLRRNAGTFDGSRMVTSAEALRRRLQELNDLGKGARTARDDGEASLIESLIEMRERGVALLPVSLYASDTEKFLLTEDKKILPPLSSLPGLGLAAARTLDEARADGPFISREDMVRRKVNPSVVDILRANGSLDGLPETSQTSLFDF